MNALRMAFWSGFVIVTLMFHKEALASDVPKDVGREPMVSVIHLIGNGAAYDNVRVYAHGYICWDPASVDVFERNDAYGLFLTKDDCDRLNYVNAVAMTIPGDTSKIPQNGSRVAVRGVFKSWLDMLIVGHHFVWGRLHVQSIHMN